MTYALGRAFWKKGYAAKMGKAVIAYGFEKFGIGCIIQEVSSENPNSISLIKQLGYRISKGLHPGQVIGVMENDGSLAAGI